ncbi:hypothetical protein V6N13_148558 [Hibiscus sabdariffa]
MFLVHLYFHILKPEIYVAFTICPSHCSSSCPVGLLFHRSYSHNKATCKLSGIREWIQGQVAIETARYNGGYPLDIPLEFLQEHGKRLFG